MGDDYPGLRFAFPRAISYHPFRAKEPVVWATVFQHSIYLSCILPSLALKACMVRKDVGVLNSMGFFFNNLGYPGNFIPFYQFMSI